MPATNNLRLTSAGRAAVADGSHSGASAVTFPAPALGAGASSGGAGNDARTPLTAERDRAAVSGATGVAKQIAFRADFSPAARPRRRQARAWKRNEARDRGKG